MVVGADQSTVAAIRVEANRAGYRQLCGFVASWPSARWAIEEAAGLGAPPERLCAQGIAVIDVPAKLARRVRMLPHRRPQWAAVIASYARANE